MQFWHSSTPEQQQQQQQQQKKNTHIRSGEIGGFLLSKQKCHL
jgi:hypothetical protein